MEIELIGHRPDRVPDGVKRAIKCFDRTLDIMPNRQWAGHDIGDRYVIAQKVKRAVETINDDIIAITDDWFPVLIIPDAMQIDNRWFINLWANKISTVKELREKLYEEQFKQQDRVINEMKDWARYEGYWAFKKQFGEYYFPGVRPKDPTRKHKELEDRLGRRPR